MVKPHRGVNLALWDTAGSEQYAPLSKFYLRNAAAALVVRPFASTQLPAQTKPGEGPYHQRSVVLCTMNGRYLILRIVKASIKLEITGSG